MNDWSNPLTPEVIVITEMRTALASYLGHRINVRGVVDEVRVDTQGTRACIKLPEMNGEVICSHIWVLGLTEDWLEAKGQQVKFSAVVRDYNNGSGRNYCLRNPSELTTINPPVVRIPKPVPKPKLPPKPVETPVDQPNSVQKIEEQPRDALAEFRTVKEFAKAAGGAGKALEVLTAFPKAMPVALVYEYLKVLAED
jgi:hypothetical protein